MTLVDDAPARSATDAPGPLPPRSAVEIPEPRRFRLKERVLGPALHTEQLEHERLGKPTALAVFASDALSSTAYASEEILRALVPAIGFLAFTSFLVPITGALVAVLVILVFSYRQTIKAYPSAGGAYIVTKDNLGLLPAQVAGVALLTDYILTVAVSVSAGMAALYSAVPSFYPYRVPMALSFIAIIAWGNLRGVKESGRIFAVPTYAFIVSMFVMLAVGIGRGVTSGFETIPPPSGHIEIGVGAVSVMLLLKGFASGGAAMTGVEAISNGVPAFRKPEATHARQTLMIMGVCLGSMFLGISFLAAKYQAVPSEKTTVISEIARQAFGGGAAGHAAFFFVQAATMLILVLAALVAIYILLGVLYESLVHPLTILSTLPSAGVGASGSLAAAPGGRITVASSEAEWRCAPPTTIGPEVGMTMRCSADEGSKRSPSLAAIWSIVSSTTRALFCAKRP